MITCLLPFLAYKQKLCCFSKVTLIIWPPTEIYLYICNSSRLRTSRLAGPLFFNVPLKHIVAKHLIGKRGTLKVKSDQIMTYADDINVLSRSFLALICRRKKSHWKQNGTSKEKHAILTEYYDRWIIIVIIVDVTLAAQYGFSGEWWPVTPFLSLMECQLHLVLA